MKHGPKSTGRWKRFFHRLAGPERSRGMLANAVRRETAGLPPFSFPLDIASVKNIVIILPADRLQALYQLRNVRELSALFVQADITVVAESSCSPLARLINGARIVEYPAGDKLLFSASMKAIGRELRGAADLCCLLTHEEDLPLLYLAGTMAAPVRIGYAGSGGPPFLNLHIDPAEVRVHAADRNAALAEMLGAKRNKGVSVIVGKNTAAEIDHLFRELHLGDNPRPAGVDALYFLHSFGQAWADACLRELIPAFKNALYLYAEETPTRQELEWLSCYNLPVIHNLTIPQTAALVKRSSVIAAGNTLLFGLAALLDMPAAGVFSRDTLARQCPDAPLVRGIAYEKEPDAATAAALVAAVAGLVSGQEAGR